jgi:hypothetical protein
MSDAELRSVAAQCYFVEGSGGSHAFNILTREEDQAAS